MQFARRLIALTVMASIAGMVVTTMGGCAATQVAIAKKDLDVQTKMSATIFLDPIAEAQRTVFVQVRNTSDRQELDLQGDIANAMATKGYRVVTDPAAAHYYLQANVLFVGKTSPTASQQALGGGYGGALGGALTGLTVGAATGANGRSMAAGALLGGVVESVSGALVKDVYYSIVTDVQIKERLASGKSTQVAATHDLKQGTSGAEKVTYNDSSDMRAYQTRVVSTANQVNLEFEAALPPLRTGLTRALSGLF